jgi:hypothetical protein
MIEVDPPERTGGRDRLREMVFSLCTPQVLHVLVELDIAGLLGDGPTTAEELARRCGAHPPALRRVLRAAVMLELLDQDGPSFTLTATGELLSTEAAGSLAGFVKTFTSPVMWRVWGELAHTVRTGDSAYQHLFGKNYFEWLAGDPEESDRFNQSMAQLSEGVAQAILASDLMEEHHLLVDVGGGSGALLGRLLTGHPDWRGVVYDTEPGLATTEATLTALGVTRRCEIVAGDFFRSVPAGADAYLLKHIVHDWDDERALTILRHCREAMAPGATMYLVESVVPDNQDALRATGRSAVIRDMNMLLSLPGRERTKAEFSELLARAGLTLATTRPLPPPGEPYHLLTARR